MNKFIKLFSKIKNGFLDMLFPKHIKCIFCNEEISELNLYDSCNNCLSSLPFIQKDYCLHCGLPRNTGASGVCMFCKNENPTFTLARAVFKYEGKVRNIIQNLKYNNAKYSVQPLAYFMFETLKKLNWQIDLITFVPIHSSKLKSRGYNQAQLLAQEISMFLDIECKDLFDKVTNTPTQTKLARQERRKNVQNSFKLKSKGFENKNILLIDDVFTTGATVNELSKILKNAKARNVYVLTLAHSVLKEKI